VSRPGRILACLPIDADRGVPAIASPARKVKERRQSGDAVTRLSEVTNKMHGLLMDRADALVGCVEGSPEEAEWAALIDVIEAYERQRRPSGKIAGGKD
jgi:hypothetical protein